MRIGINAHLLSFEPTYRQAGVSRYIEALAHYLPGVAPEDELVLFTGPARPPDARFHDRIEWHRSRLPTANPVARIFWEQALAPVVVRRSGVDLMHFPVNVVSMISTVPQVVTVHDLAFHHFPEQYPPMKQRYLRLMTRLAVRRATRVIAVSEATRQDVIRMHGCNPERVITVPNGVVDEMRPLPDAEVAAFRREFDLPQEFILFLGTLQPRKNLERLLKAYAAIATETDWPLVIAGAVGWHYEEIFQRVEQLGLAQRVRFMGHVAGEDLPRWYNAATLFVYPSLYEGFGLPVLEAMACGTPVMASNTSALPEVVGDCGVLVDPLDEAAMATSMLTLVRDANLRQQLGQRARERAKSFTWRKTTERTLAVYRDVLQSSR